MPILSEVETLAIITERLKRAPHVAAIYHAIREQEDHAQDASDLAWQKQQRQNEKVAEAHRNYNAALSNANSAQPEHKAEAQRIADRAEAEWKRQIELRNGMKGSVIYDGLPSAAIAAAIQKINFAHVLDGNAPHVAAGSLEAIADLHAKREALEAERADIGKRPAVIDEAVARGVSELSQACRKERHKWRISGYFGADKSRVEIPDARAMMMILFEPLLREGLTRQIRELGKAMEFEAPLSASERKAEAVRIDAAIAENVALEAAHIRALALAGQCPKIRDDFPVKTLLALVPDASARADYEAALADLKKHGSVSHGPSTRIVV